MRQAVLLGIAALFVAPGCAPSVGPGDGGLVEAIVYTSLAPPNWDVYLFENAEEAPRRITSSPARDYNAVFSPDGRWIVFTSERAGNADLYALDLETHSPPVPLTRNRGMDDAATFSPDGGRLAFVSTRDGDADIFVMPFAPGDPSAERRAANLTRRPGGDFNPAFSPDGRWIAFARQDDLWTPGDLDTGALGSAMCDVYVMGADGSDPRRLTAPGAISGSPAWSPDGESVYYYRIALGAEIRRVARDGSDDAGLRAFGLSPAVMADGRVAFVQPQFEPGMDPVDALRTGRIFSVLPDGSGLRPQSDDSTDWFAPDFDRRSGRMLVHGAGPIEDDLAEISEGFAFAPPGGVGRVDLPDRTIEVRGVRGYFPAITPGGGLLSTTLPFEPIMPLRSSALNGDGLRPLFQPDGVAWGVAIARAAETAVVAVGPPFADGTHEVDIWSFDLDGTNGVNLTADVEANDALPHVSADGSRIVFRSGGDHGGRVYVMDSDGANRRRLTSDDALETMPALSSDGEWVVFPTTVAGGWKLRIQRIDGGEGRFLEPDRLHIPDVSMHPRFSPDDKWVVFTSNRSFFNDEWPLTWFPQPYGELWAVPVAGGEAVRLTHNKWEDGPCDWADVRLEP